MASAATLGNPFQRRAILILGMHRSGTSALGGVMRSLGVAAPKQLIIADADNRRGYWESLLLVHADEQLLASIGSRWHDWLPLEPRWAQTELGKRHRETIEQILADEFADETLFFIKDPRACRFIPFLTSVLAAMNVSTVALLPFRNPLEVAFSLKRRDGFPLSKSLLLWLRHVLDAEFHSRTMPRHFISYDGLLTDWRKHVDGAREKLGIEWPVDRQIAEPVIDSFLTEDLHHERCDVGQVRSHPDVPHLVADTYDVLRALLDEGERPALLARLDAIRDEFEKGCRLFGPAHSAQELAIAQGQQTTAEKTREVERLQASFAADRERLEQELALTDALRAALHGKEAENQHLSAQLQASSAEVDRWRDALAHKEAEARKVAAKLLRSETDAEHLRKMLAAEQATRAADAERATVELLRSGKEAEQLRQALAAEQAERAAAAADLRALEAKLDELLQHALQTASALRASAARNEELSALLSQEVRESRGLRESLHATHQSRSWRVTKPLRAIGGLLGRRSPS
jgi:hypothetical protein